MAMTIEEFDRTYKGDDEDEYAFIMQSALGTQEERDSAYDENGNFHCIDYYDCSL